jgi:hypothetical protein
MQTNRARPTRRKWTPQMITEPNRARRYRAERRRVCARPGCSAPTVATLRFQSTRREAWLVEVDYDAASTEGDLCAKHAGTLVLPRGWRLHDERTQIHLVEPVKSMGPELIAEAVEVVAPDADDPTPAEDLATLLDARTPLLQRAFESAKATKAGA